MFSPHRQNFIAIPLKGVLSQSRKHCFGAQPHGFSKNNLFARKNTLFSANTQAASDTLL